MKYISIIALIGIICFQHVAHAQITRTDQFLSTEIPGKSLIENSEACIKMIDLLSKTITSDSKDVYFLPKYERYPIRRESNYNFDAKDDSYWYIAPLKKSPRTNDVGEVEAGFVSFVDEGFETWQERFAHGKEIVRGRFGKSTTHKIIDDSIREFKCDISFGNRLPVILMFHLERIAKADLPDKLASPIGNKKSAETEVKSKTSNGATTSTFPSLTATPFKTEPSVEEKAVREKRAADQKKLDEEKAAATSKRKAEEAAQAKLAEDKERQMCMAPQNRNACGCYKYFPKTGGDCTK